MSPIFTTESPTLEELRTAVCAKGYATNTGGLDDAINGAYREVMAARRWPFTTQGEAFTLPANADSVSIGNIADLLHVEAVRLFDGTTPVNLEWCEQQALRSQAHEDDVPGVPALWSRLGVDILVYPRAVRECTIEVDYAPNVISLVAGTDQPLVPRLYMDAIVWGAAAELAARQRDFSSVDRFEKKRDDAVARMARAYAIEQRQGGRRVTETGVWDEMA